MKKITLVITILIMLSAIWGWEMVEQNDSFGDANGKFVLIGDLVSGKFSNSATTSSELTGFFAIGSSDDILISLWEYGLYSRNESAKFIDVKIKDDNNVVHKLKMLDSGNLFAKSDTKENEKIINLVKVNNKLKFYFERDRSSYNWELDCAGFSKSYKEMTNDSDSNK